MASYKKRFEYLVDETELLREAAERQADASDAAVSAIDQLRNQVKSSTRDLVGGMIVAAVVQNVVAAALTAPKENPRQLMARKCYDVLHIISDAMNRGDRLNYGGIVNLLVMHELSHAEAEYFVERLVNRYQALVEWVWEDGSESLMLDPDSEFMKACNAAVRQNQLPYF